VTRHHERLLKNGGSRTRYCPICTPIGTRGGWLDLVGTAELTELADAL
jgi:hypothetical protein